MNKKVENTNEEQQLHSTLRDRFENGDRAIWQDVAEDQWNSWVWQQQNRVRNKEGLLELLNLSADEKEAVEKSEGVFNMSITPYYASLMDKDDPNCPVRQQAVPKMGEFHILETDLEDPLGEEKDMPVPGITHRYPDRVLFYTTHNCPVYCRHCTRKRKVSDPKTAARQDQIEEGLEYIRNHPEVRDIVISGGDPLSNSDQRLEQILKALREIPHVEIIRLGTRNPVTLPQRITPALTEMLAKYAPIYVNTHFNHPKECTKEAFDACARLVNAGCVVGNQMVLLKGVNDDPKVVKELNHKLLMMRVRPYYIFQCDLAQGISHFRTPIETGLNIIENLRGWTSGLAVPHFVVDAPGGGGKIPLGNPTVVRKDGKQVTLRNFQQKEYTYVEPDED